MTTTEHLTTGWEPDTDPTDTMVRRYLHAWIAQCDAFVRSVGGTTTTTASWTLTAAAHPTGLFNAATLTAPLDAEDPWGTIAEIEAAAIEAGTVHLWSAWPTPDLRQRGWHLVGHPPLLIRPPARLAPAPAPTAAIEVVEVGRDTELVAWEQIVIDDYPFAELQPYRPQTMVGPSLLGDPRFRLHVGLQDGRPASASALMTHQGLGLFAFAVTSPSARGRGHWRAHTIERLRLAPHVWMAGVFSDDSRPLAEACGFIPVQRLTLWARACT